MRIDETADQTSGAQPFDDGFSLNPASELRPVGLFMPEVELEGRIPADTAEIEPGMLTQSELDLRAGEKITEGQSLSPIEASLRRLGRDRRAMVCLAIIVIMVVTSYVFPMFYLHLCPFMLGGITDTSPIPPELYHYMTHQELLNL